MTSRFSNPRTLVATATYNERDNIDLLLQEIFRLQGDLDALVIDDASPDGTGDYLRSLAASNSRLHLVHRSSKLGLGSAHQLAFLYAIQNGYDRLVTMDADISHDPAEIPLLLAALENSDMVIGSRYAPGGKCDYRGYRRFVSISANTLARILLSIPLHEFTTSFRAFDVDMLRRFRCAKLRSNGYSFFTETVFRLHSAGFRITEVPIYFKDRYTGVSKFPAVEIVKGVTKLLRLAASRLTGRNAFKPAAEIDGDCAHCGAPYLIEIYPASASRDGAAAASAYQCSSLAHKDKPQVVQCLMCGIVHVPKSQIPEALEDIYRAVEDPTYLNDEKARTRAFEETLAKISPHLGPPGKIMEIGAYCGLFLEVAKQAGWQCSGVEPSHWAVQIAAKKDGITVHKGTLSENLAALGSGFDAVVAWDVLEHVREPFELLREVNKLLRPGGVVCFSTLDIDNWFASLLGRHWPWIMEMHLYYFSETLLRRWLDDAGYEAVEVSRYTHFASLRYICKKAAAIMPRPLCGLLHLVSRSVPAAIVVPVSLGDIKLFIARKR